MKMFVSNAVHELGVRNPFVGIIENIRVPQETPPEIVHNANRVLNNIEADMDGYLNDPTIYGYRELFSNLGYENLVPAGERLVRNFKEKGFKSYGPLIDAYNVVALKYAAGIGMHDADEIRGDIHIDVASGEETIMPLFKDKPKRLRAGDLCYTDDQRVIAWLGKRDVDSDWFKLSEYTKEILIVILGNAYTSEDFNRTVAHEIVAEMRQFSPNAKLQELRRGPTE